MTLIFAYAVLMTAALASVTALVDMLLRPRRVPARGLWGLALAAVLPVTGFIMVVPTAGPTEVAMVQLPDATGRGVESVTARPPRVEPLVTLDEVDRVLAWGWLAASLGLLALIGAGQWQLARARSRARPGTLHEHAVLVTDDLGPAVAGLARPVVLLPRWVTALDEPSQRLLLAHELEHARTRDTAFLIAGAIVVALVPWNPVVWWLVRRLRLAVELDCDRRVLDANPAIRQYADLLLLAAGRNRLSTGVLAAHFGEHSSDLERRIFAMTDSKLHLRPAIAMTLASALMIAAACEAPRPDPVAPRAQEESPVVREVPVDWKSEGTRLAADAPLTIAKGVAFPRYPDILRQAGVEGEVLVRFIVTADGTPEPSSIEVVKSSHDLFAIAVRKTMEAMRYDVANGESTDGREFTQPFVFKIVGTGMEYVERAVTPGELPAAVISGVLSGKREVVEPTGRPRGEPTVVVRTAKSLGIDLRPNIIVRSMDGTELRRYLAKTDATLKSGFADIDPQDIEAIEVYKPTACPADTPVPCPFIAITVKRGLEATYRAK